MAHSGGTNEVLVFGRSAKRKKKFKKITGVLLSALHLKQRVISVSVLSRREMVRLKRRSLPHAKGPANVVSLPFPKYFPHPETRHIPLGEVCVDGEYHGKDDKDFALLLIHGILHLMGYDHEKSRDMLIMKNKEQELWQHISSLV